MYSLFLGVVVIFLPWNLAAEVHERFDTSGTIILPVTKHFGTLKNTRLVPRADDKKNVTLGLENHVNYYLANLTVGIPEQKVQVVVDTGSSDLWLYDSSVKGYGQYTPSLSSAYHLLSQGKFNANYVKGQARGDWVTDSLSTGSWTLPNFRFGVAYQYAGFPLGLLGVGRKALESTSHESNPQESSYANFPEILKSIGAINRLAFSLYLDNLNGSSGSILFGGIDHAKYTGELGVVKFDDPVTFSVPFTIDGLGTYSGVLDSGTSFMYLPTEVYESFVGKHETSWGLKWQNGYYTTSVIPPGDGLSLRFEDSIIKIPQEGLFFKFPGGADYVFGLLPNTMTANMTWLGDVFLRYAYVVFDLESNVAGIAQANHTEVSDVVALTNKQWF